MAALGPFIVPAARLGCRRARRYDATVSLNAYPPGRARALAEVLELAEYDVVLDGPTPTICIDAWLLERALGVGEEVDAVSPPAQNPARLGVEDIRPDSAKREAEKLADLVVAATGTTKDKAMKFASAFPGGRGLAVAGASTFRAAGLTSSQASRLAAAFGLFRAAEYASRRGQTINTPAAAAAFLRSYLQGSEEENFLAVLVDARQQPFHVIHVARGSLAQVDVHPRELFRDAVRLSAHSIILAHNHPSGVPQPSDADIELTHRMGEAGRIVGIRVLDHIIVTDREFTSLAQLGLVGR